jgi:hypothetical protein
VRRGLRGQGIWAKTEAATPSSLCGGRHGSSRRSNPREPRMQKYDAARAHRTWLALGFTREGTSATGLQLMLRGGAKTDAKRCFYTYLRVAPEFAAGRLLLDPLDLVAGPGLTHPLEQLRGYRRGRG